MTNDKNRTTAMRERARRKLLQEKQSMSAKEKAQLPVIQRRLARKVHSSLSARRLLAAGT